MWRRLIEWWNDEPVPNERPTIDEVRAFTETQRHTQESMKEHRDQVDRLERLLHDLKEKDDSGLVK